MTKLLRTRGESDPEVYEFVRFRLWTHEERVGFEGVLPPGTPTNADLKIEHEGTTYSVTSIKDDGFNIAGPGFTDGFWVSGELSRP